MDDSSSAPDEARSVASIEGVGGAPGARDPSRTAWLAAFALLCVAHVATTCVVLPPWSALPAPFLARIDYPVHSHRAHVHREARREIESTHEGAERRCTI